MVAFTYHIINGELCKEGVIFIDCNKALMHGVAKRRMWDEEMECFRDIEAFYIKFGATEYGNIGLDLDGYIALCKGVAPCAVGTQCPPDKIFVCQFDDPFE